MTPALVRIQRIVEADPLQGPIAPARQNPRHRRYPVTWATIALADTDRHGPSLWHTALCQN